MRVPESEISSRIRRFQELLGRSGIQGALILHRVDLLYFSGTAQNAYLFIPDRGEPLLLVKKYLPRAREESSLTSVTGISSVLEIPERIKEASGGLPEKLGMAFDVTTAKDLFFFKKIMGPHEVVDISGMILGLRMIKSDWEINMMRQVAELSRMTFRHAASIIKEGVSEMVFAGELETFARSLGHEGMLNDRNFRIRGYPWHILSGESGGEIGLLDSPASGFGTSYAFPCGAGPRLIRPGEPVMVDFGWVRYGYHMDETRMFALGKMPEEAKKACDAAIRILDLLRSAARPGMEARELFNMSVSLAEKLGYEDSFLGPKGKKVGFVGHGIGLELVEPPFIARNRKDKLCAGMAIALEPKIVFEKRFSAGIESVFLMTREGLEPISRVPAEYFIV